MLGGTGLLLSVIYAAFGLCTNLPLIVLIGAVEGVLLVFQQPVAQGLLADASPATARGRAQGLAGTIGAVGGGTAAGAALPLYHVAHPLPFIAAGVLMAAGSLVAGAGALTMAGRRPHLAAARPARPAGQPAQGSTA